MRPEPSGGTAIAVGSLKPRATSRNVTFGGGGNDRALPGATCSGDVSTASKSLPCSVFSWSSSVSFQAAFCSPVKYHGLPLSASTMP